MLLVHLEKRDEPLLCEHVLIYKQHESKQHADIRLRNRRGPGELPVLQLPESNRILLSVCLRLLLNRTAVFRTVSGDGASGWRCGKHVLHK